MNLNSAQLKKSVFNYCICLQSGMYIISKYNNVASFETPKP